MKSALLTGAYGAIGIEIAKGLARQRFRLLLVGRQESKLQQLKKEILMHYQDCICHTYRIDISSKKQVEELAAKVDEKIDVLINNAATAPVRRLTTQEGIEMQWATNVLGYYWMIKSFEKQLRRTENPRIINVASYWAGGLDLNDPEFKNRKYDNDTAYRQSKQADRMLTYGFAELYEERIMINACHPGDANSKLSNDLGFGGSESAGNAAKTPLLLATTSAGMETTGKYFEHGKIANCRFAQDRKAIDQLMRLCETY